MCIGVFNVFLFFISVHEGVSWTGVVCESALSLFGSLLYPTRNVLVCAALLWPFMEGVSLLVSIPP